MSHRKLIEQYLAAYTSFDVEGMLELLSDGVAFENYLDDQLTASASGKQAFRELAASSSDIFSEREQKIVSLRMDDSRAIAVVQFRGVFAKSFENGPQCGDVMELTGKSEFEFEDGRITRIIDRA